MTTVGVLLINTGTPDNPDEESVRRFLKEMLSDPALISVPPIIWKRVLKYFILPKRPKKTVGLYRKMWTERGSLFMEISRKQQSALQHELQNRSTGEDGFEVCLAMRYGTPSIESQVKRLRERGCGTVIVLPLYPQYVNVCAGTCLAEFRRCMNVQADGGWNPEIIEVDHFHDQPAYMHVLAQSVKRRWSYKTNSKLIVSFHSTLMADIDAGDPYREQTHETASKLAVSLGVPEEDVMVSYQSRFDSRKWLQPFTDDVLEQAAVMGVDDVCVVCPGFVAENIESKLEAGEQLRDEFLERAIPGARYTYIPTLDDDPGLIAALADAVEQAMNRV